MFVRFISTLPDPETGRPFGIFHAAGIVSRDPMTPQYVVDLISEEQAWFNANLKRPSRFSKSARPHANKVALSWFLPTAIDHIEHARTLAALVSDHTFPVVMTTSSKPGIIVYRDDVQIAAVPYRD